jgi:hypothetical protein
MLPTTLNQRMLQWLSQWVSIILTSVTVWGNGGSVWEGDSWDFFFFFFKTIKVKEGLDPVFCQHFLFFAFLV